MRLLSLTLILSFVLLACDSEQGPSFNRNPKEVVSEFGIDVEAYDYENFKPFLNQKDDQIHVINFWATWCVPCVAELPYFEQLGAEYPEIEIVLVSLDFPKKIKENLIPFIQKNTLKSEVILLDEPDGNKWIPQIDPNWSGAIPATIIYKNDKSKFYEQSFNFAELEEAIALFDN
ncbi:MAG: TlpA family protein disulfide reductase [Crocinitomix sp.]|nr:TlpA family protein disulfide reductase [Crocinitomix sp.]